MTVWRKQTAARRHSTWVFLLTLVIGVLCWLVAASMVRGLASASAAETGAAASPEIAYSPAPKLALQTPPSKPQAGDKEAGDKEAKPEQKKSGSKNSGNKKRNEKKNDKSVEGVKPAEFSAAEETAVQEFLTANHPELSTVLGSLKKKHAKAYAHAIEDLSHTQKRLEQVRKHDQERYERDLEAWQLKSRMQLLVARIKMSPDDQALRVELKQAVEEQISQQREQLTAERARLQQRLEKLDDQLQKLTDKPEVLVEQRMKQWLSSTEGGLKPNGQKKKDAKQNAAANQVKDNL